MFRAHPQTGMDVLGRVRERPTLTFSDVFLVNKEKRPGRSENFQLGRFCELIDTRNQSKRKMIMQLYDPNQAKSVFFVLFFNIL